MEAATLLEAAAEAVMESVIQAATVRKRRKKQIQEVKGAPCTRQRTLYDGRSSSSDIIDGQRAASNNQCFSNNIQDIMQLNALTWKSQTWFHLVMEGP
jgi:hypothetical protein